MRDRESSGRGHDYQQKAVRGKEHCRNLGIAHDDAVGAFTRLSERTGDVRRIAHGHDMLAMHLAQRDDLRIFATHRIKQDGPVSLNGAWIVLDVVAEVERREIALADAPVPAGERDTGPTSAEQRLVGEHHKTMRPQGERIEFRNRQCHARVHEVVSP